MRCSGMDAGVAMAGQQRGYGVDLVALAGGFLQQHPGLRVSIRIDRNTGRCSAVGQHTDHNPI